MVDVFSIKNDASVYLILWTINYGFLEFKFLIIRI